MFSIPEEFQETIEENRLSDLQIGILQEEIKSAYRQSLYRLNKPNLFENAGNKFRGTITDVDDEGRLCIEREGAGQARYQMKDLRFLI